MSYVSQILGVAILTCSVAAAVAQDSTTEVLRDAQQLADCAKALDATCVIQLSDAASYERIASPEAHFNFAQSQSRFYAGMRRNGYQYTRFDVYAPSVMFSGDDNLYAFVPYVDTLEIPGHATDEVRAFFIAISRDAGNSWKFVDAEGLKPENLKKIIPSYSEQPLPIVHTTESE
jgi:hypothetical protein